MKKILTLAAIVASTLGIAHGETIVYWDFNSDDSDGATGTLTSRVGDAFPPTGIITGTAQILNAAYRFQYSANDDVRVFEQSAVRITTFPNATVSNKTAGPEFRFSTVGYEGITATYQGYYSSAVSKYWRIQYTPDGSTWVDHQVIEPTVDQAQKWIYYSIDFAGITEADNNPNFGFRIVAEWQSTATGKGTPAYLGIAQGYNVGAQFWVDTMTVDANPIDASNTRPTISPIVTQETTEGVATVAIPFTISDAEDAVDSLTLDWGTVGTDLVDAVVFGGSGANRTVTVTPKAGAIGTATITLKVTDTSGKFAITSFAVNIRPTIPTGAIVYWNFNSAEQDGNPATGTFEPRFGEGTAEVINASYTFANSASGLDPWTVDNTLVRMNGFPAPTVENKTAGIEFRFSTGGREGVAMSWDHNNGNTGSRYYRAQYTADGVNWIDHVVITNAVGGWLVYSVDFKGIRAADNNPNFGVRLVTEFESTATGAGAANYVQSQNTAAAYTTSGTWWVDRVTFTAEPLNAANIAPTIAATSAITARAAAASIEIPFTIGDVETSAANLTVNWSTPTPTQISGATLGGSGANRTLTVVPSGVVGIAELVLVVTDAGGKYSEARIVLDLLPANTAPTISGLTNVEMLANTTSNVVVTVSDLEQSGDSLVLTVESTSPWLLDSTNVVITGTGADRTLAITPAANTAGAAWVTVTVSDGTLTDSISFMLKVRHEEVIALWNFNSIEPDANASTGSLEPAIGTGIASSVGTSTNSLNTGLSAASFDPETADNSKWRLGSFPEQSTGNKTSGAQFMFSTVGFKNIAASWDHYNSASASKYWRVQYTLDGTTFTDFLVYTNPVVTTFRPTGASFTHISEANNNPNFGVRIVSEFESTATGEGLDNYVAVSGGNYGTAGTLWLDMVTISGDSTGPSGPALQIVRNGNEIVISWPEGASGDLQSTDNLSTPNWQSMAVTPEVVNGKKTVVLRVGTISEFFRLGSNN